MPTSNPTPTSNAISLPLAGGPALDMDMLEQLDGFAVAFSRAWDRYKQGDESVTPERLASAANDLALEGAVYARTLLPCEACGSDDCHGPDECDPSRLFEYDPDAVDSRETLGLE